MYQPQSTQHYYRNDDEVDDNNKVKISKEAQLHELKPLEQEYIINEDDDVIIDDDDYDDYVDENNISKYNTEQLQELEIPNIHRYHVNHADREEIANKPIPFLSLEEEVELPEEPSELLYNEEELEQMYMESEININDEDEEEEVEEEVSIEEDDEDNTMEEEDDIPTYPLPPLPPVELPSTIHGTPTHEMYGIISEIRRLIDDSVERERVKEMLLHDPNVLVGVAQVLHECGLLRRPVIQPLSSHNVITHELLPLPLGPTPPLPSGYTSWIVEEPAAMTSPAQTSIYINNTKNISNQ